MSKPNWKNGRYFLYRKFLFHFHFQQTKKDPAGGLIPSNFHRVPKLNDFITSEFQLENRIGNCEKKNFHIPDILWDCKSS